MHIPIDIIQAVTAGATVARPVTVTNTRGVSVAVTHHDVGSQLGEHSSHEFFGYDEVIDLNAAKKFS